MTDLERRLVELGRELELPPTPDLASGVRARLARGRRPRTLLGRRPLLVALGALVAALATAMAVPQARTAILELLGVRGVGIEKVERTPRAPRRLPNLGRLVPFAVAQRLVSYRILVPPLKRQGPPDRVYVLRSVPGGQVSIVFFEGDAPNAPRGERVRLFLTQFRALEGIELAAKEVGPQTTVEPVTVRGGRGVWIEGAPHVFFYLGLDGEPRMDTRSLVGNALVWERGGVTLRLPGDIDKARALELARNTR